MELAGLTEPATWLALLSLVAMEVVLGIDNIVFITILTSRLPEGVRDRTARVGIGLALVMRVGLLFTISWIMSLTRELATVLNVSITGKSLILMVGGVFLIGKATLELHKKIDEEDDAPVGTSNDPKARVAIVLAQIVLLDLVFSLDSVITAVGMVPPEQIWVMVVAIVVSVGVMLAGAKPIAGFVTRHPTMKVLALAFLILIGVMLLAEGIGQTIPKGYIYFAMAFSILVELVNIKIRKPRPEPKELPKTS
ncbi:MAG: TerC family protein [Sandaracinaceae bacterium]|nr:TerC family protein [Sandaracinaceae bacterium]